MEVITPILILLYLIIKDVIRLPSRYETESQIDRLGNRLNRISNQLKDIKDQKDKIEDLLKDTPDKEDWRQTNFLLEGLLAKEANFEQTIKEDWSQKELERRAIEDFQRQHAKEDWKQKELERRARIKELLKDRENKDD